MNARFLIIFAYCALALYYVPQLDAAETETVNAPAAFTVQKSGAGRPMILIPGLGCGGNVWDDTVAYFKGAYECHVLTLAGFAGNPAIGNPFLERVRDELVAYIRNQKLERPIIIGHSLGGFLAFWIGSSLPDELGAVISVDGVPFYSALRDPNASPQSSLRFAQAQWMGMVMQTPEQFANSNRMILTGMITDPKEVQRVSEVSSKSDPKAVAQAAFELMTIDLRAKVKTIEAPLLLIGATSQVKDIDRKKTIEANYQSQVSTAPRHKIVFAPKARHFIQLDEPAYFIETVETFLKEMKDGSNNNKPNELGKSAAKTGDHLGTE